MTTGGPNPPRPGGKPPAKVSPARNVVGLVLLVGFAGAAAVEFLAVSGFNSAVGTLNKRMPKETDDPNAKIAELPAKSEVEKILGRSPDGPLTPSGGERTTTYTWQGLRKHSIRAFFSSGKDPALIRTE